MKILYLTPWSPIVLNVGASTRSRCLWRSLRELGEVTTLVFDQYEPLISSEDAENNVFHRKWFSPYKDDAPTTLKLLIKSFTGQFDTLFKSKSEILDEFGLSGKDFDIVVVRYEWTMRNTAAWKIAPAYLDFDDLPIEFFRVCDCGRTKGIARIKAMIRIFLWQLLLQRVCVKTWLSNPVQVRNSYVGKSRVVALPNIANGPGDGYVLRPNVSPYLVTVGSWKYPPNVLGITWFLNNIWPDVHKLHPDLSYWIVGPHLDGVKAKEWSCISGVKVVGFVDDLLGVYSNATGLVAAVFGGGGTCIKVVEAQCYGCKVFATDDGARGFSAEECKRSHLAIFSDKTTFLDQLNLWVGKTECEKLVARKEIFDFAMRRNSYEVFSAVVKKTIKG